MAQKENLTPAQRKDREEMMKRLEMLQNFKVVRFVHKLNLLKVPSEYLGFTKRKREGMQK